VRRPDPAKQFNPQRVKRKHLPWAGETICLFQLIFAESREYFDRGRRDYRLLQGGKRKGIVSYDQAGRQQEEAQAQEL